MASKGKPPSKKAAAKPVPPPPPDGWKLYETDERFKEWVDVLLFLIPNETKSVLLLGDKDGFLAERMVKMRFEVSVVGHGGLLAKALGDKISGARFVSCDYMTEPFGADCILIPDGGNGIGLDHGLSALLTKTLNETLMAVIMSAKKPSAEDEFGLSEEDLVEAARDAGACNVGVNTVGDNIFLKLERAAIGNDEN